MSQILRDNIVEMVIQIADDKEFLMNRHNGMHLADLSQFIGEERSSKNCIGARNCFRGKHRWCG